MSDERTAAIRLVNYIHADNTVGAQRVMDEAGPGSKREILEAIVHMASKSIPMSTEMSQWANELAGGEKS